QYKVLKCKSLDAFAVLPDCRFKEYAKDRERVYYMGKRIPGVDSPSFQIFKSDRMGEAPPSPSYHFARDRSHIYFDGKQIQDADYNSFRVVHAPGLGNLEYGIDKSNAFHKSQRNGKLARIAQGSLPLIVQEHLSKTNT